MAIIDQIQKDMLVAMKAKDEARLGAIRMAKAALMKEKVDTMKVLDEAAELRVLSVLLKQRREAADMYRKAGREEQAVKEEAESAIIAEYMPALASDAELDEAITAAIAETGATSAKQMGAVMTAAKAKLGGKRADGKVLSERVKARLG